MQKKFKLLNTVRSAHTSAFSFLLSLLLFSSCAWRLDPSLQTEETRTISIPYVQGDKTGELTAKLIQAIDCTSGLQFSQDQGELTLKVKLLDKTYDNIGFRFDHRELHKHKRKLIASETRQLDLAEINVVENGTGNIILGPCYILSSIDYDHQNYNMNSDVNVYSLGQLSDIDTTEDSLDTPRFRALAKEIAKFLHDHFEKIKRKTNNENH